jgi:DNA modification methylase
MPKMGRTYGQDILKGEYQGIDGKGSIGRRFRHARPDKVYNTKDWVDEKGISGNAAETSGAGTSVFDPVLCELAYAWFCPPGGLVLDPFAGGSVRGVVAARMGRRYLGIDLSKAQLDANRAQAKAILDAAGEAKCRWIEGDSQDLDALVSEPADFVFSCPPYFDLERYSDDPRDLSNMRPDAFLEAYRGIVAKAAARLRDNRFACFVVGDVRDPGGAYRNLPGETIAAFQSAGLKLYNEAILVTAAGSLPIRAGRQFEASRKLGKTHQNCLIFVKGDATQAAKVVGPCQFGTITDPGGEDDESVGLL